MVNSFRDLKKNRDAMFEALNKEIENGNKRGGRPEADPRFFYPEVDQSGNGFAIIRFLPAPPGEAIPYITEYAHGFKGPGGWYIERSRTTLGRDEKDPVSDYNRAQWVKSEDPANAHIKDQIQSGVKGRKRTTSFIANIQVVKYPANPELEGKEFLYRYGFKLHKKIEEKMKPQFEGDTPVNPFDPWGGCNLRLKITTSKPAPGQKKGFRNYDTSEWESPTPLGTDAEIEAIWKREHPLQPLIAPDTFKSYEALEKQFNRAMGFDKRQMEGVETAEASSPREAAVDMSRFTSGPSTQSNASDDEVPWDTSDTTETNNNQDGDEDLAYFRSLAGMPE